MSKLEQLIKKLCPNGVEYKELGDVILKNSFKQIGASDLESLVVENGNIKLLPSSKNNDLWTTEKVAKDFICEGEVITLGRARYANLKYFKGKFVSSNNHIIISKSTNEVLGRYLYHFISNHATDFYIDTSTYPKLDNNIFETYKIPVPPLAVQLEIVRILDNFTELTAELTARRKQYEYYRDKLLTFGDDVERKPLGESIISLTTGLNPRKFFTLNTNDAQNYYVTIREMQNNTIKFSDKTDRINDNALKLCNNRSNLEVGDVLFSGTGTIGKTTTINIKPSNWDIKEGVYSIKPNQEKILSRFLMHLLQSKELRSNYLSKVAGATVKSVPMSEIRKLLIPLPSLSEQKRIVKILDCFDMLCNDISIGLPAEINARKQQYEYYRDKLLTFKQA